jgi:2-haloacid dehalogenase
MHWHERYENMFDFAIASHLAGAAKPSPAIFAVLEIEAGVPSEEIFFFDDSQTNVDAACAFGMRGYLAMGLDGLIAALERAGLMHAS